YEVVRDDFTKDGGQVFDTDKATDQAFTVVVKAKTVTVTPEDPKDPGTPVDPGKPDGPKWPDGVKESDLNQTVTRTIKYQYEDGSKAKDDVVETLTYKRTATVNLVTKEVTYGEWTSTDNAFDKVDTPAIAGYTPDKASVEAEADVPAESADKEVIVTYVKDVPKEATVTVKYVDENGREILPPETITGKVGDPYTTNGKVISGYYLVEVPANQTGTISASGTTVVYVYGKLGSWVPSVPTGVDPVPPIPYPNDPTDPSKPGTDLPVLPHVPGHIPVGPDGVTPLTPVDPSDPSKGYILPPVPSNPGTDTPITYVPEAPKEATVTVKYVDENGREILPPEAITGKVGDPYTTSGKVISGYYLVEVPANQTGTISASGTTVVYVYGKLGSWVPSVPTGVDPVPPIPYPNDPMDPSKPGTDLPVLPHVPGHIPVGPDGVSPLTPVDPSDPSKGYILPPVPSDPGADTPITYVPEAPKEATVTVKYVDENGREILPPETITGKVGDPYTTSGKVISGYYLVEVPANQTGTISASGTTVVYVYGKLGSWVPSVPTGVDPVPPIPYPNDPTDPSKPGTDLPVLPHVPGHIPVGPDGVSPLTPVDPSDPSKGYILPPVPSNPGMDTPITYVPVPQPQEPIVPEPTRPTPPALPTQPSAPVKPMAPVSPTAPASPTQNKVTADKASQRTLPNTGDSSSDIALMAGISLLMATLGMVVKARKED
ncbi:TPA: MucBP domain-containing protein, partial [Streptococcus suis]